MLKSVVSTIRTDLSWCKLSLRKNNKIIRTICYFSTHVFYTLTVSFTHAGVQLPLPKLKNHKEGFIGAEVYIYPEIHAEHIYIECGDYLRPGYP